MSKDVILKMGDFHFRIDKLSAYKLESERITLVFDGYTETMIFHSVKEYEEIQQIMNIYFDIKDLRANQNNNETGNRFSSTHLPHGNS